MQLEGTSGADSEPHKPSICLLSYGPFAMSGISDDGICIICNLAADIPVMIGYTCYHVVCAKHLTVLKVLDKIKNKPRKRSSSAVSEKDLSSLPPPFHPSVQRESRPVAKKARSNDDNPFHDYDSQGWDGEAADFSGDDGDAGHPLQHPLNSRLDNSVVRTLPPSPALSTENRLPLPFEEASGVMLDMAPKDDLRNKRPLYSIPSSLVGDETEDEDELQYHPDAPLPKPALDKADDKHAPIASPSSPVPAVSGDAAAGPMLPLTSSTSSSWMYEGITDSEYARVGAHLDESYAKYQSQLHGSDISMHSVRHHRD